MADDADTLTLERATRALGRFEAEMRWRHGRELAALKVGKRTFSELRDAIAFRDAIEGRGPQPALAPFGPFAGLPVYVCNATDHFEKVYADEDLKARLKDEPAALP